MLYTVGRSFLVFVIVEIGGGMTKEEVNKLYNNLIPRSKKVEAIARNPTKRGASTYLHQPNKTSKPSDGMGKSLTITN